MVNQRWRIIFFKYHRIALKMSYFGNYGIADSDFGIRFCKKKKIQIIDQKLRQNFLNVIRNENLHPIFDQSPVQKIWKGWEIKKLNQDS